MNEIKIQLEKLESIFRETDAPILQFLNHGLHDDEIISFLFKNNIPVHQDLLSLYQWHNGLISVYGRDSSLIEFLPMGAFPNLTEMASLRGDFMSYDYFEVENREEYIPILSGGEDDMHLLRISTGEIYYSSPGIQVYCEPKFNSLSAMLDFILSCYEKKILKMHSIDGLLIDKSYWEINNSHS